MAKQFTTPPAGWTLIGTLSNRTDSLSIPADATEVFILCHFVNTVISYSCYIPVVAIEDYISIRNGYYINSSTNGFCDFRITAEKEITLASSIQSTINGNANDITIKAWYK